MEEESNTCSKCRRIVKNCECFVCTYCGCKRQSRDRRWGVTRAGETAFCDQGDCSRCCRHFYCQECGVWRDSGQYHQCVIGGQSRCRRATAPFDGCCQHPVCVSCGNHITSVTIGFCTQCNMCFNCDRAHRPRPAYEWVAYPLKFWGEKLTRAERRRNSSSRMIGAEIEISQHANNHSILPVCEKWQASIVRDGSVLYEINTAPAAGDLYVAQIEEICAELKKQGATAGSNAGLHVHVDARDFSYMGGLRQLILLYEKIEPALLLMLPESRRKNPYCIPCGPDLAEYIHKSPADPKSNREAIIRAIYGNRRYLTQYRKSKYFQGTLSSKIKGRYAALNLHSFYFRGTIECRLHQGTVDPAEIIAWSMLWAGIMDFASGTTDGAIAALPKDPTECLLAIALNDEVKSYIKGQAAKFQDATDRQRVRAAGLSNTEAALTTSAWTNIMYTAQTAQTIRQVP